MSGFVVSLPDGHFGVEGEPPGAHRPGGLASLVIAFTSLATWAAHWIGVYEIDLRNERQIEIRVERSICLPLWSSRGIPVSVSRRLPRRSFTQ